MLVKTVHLFTIGRFLEAIERCKDCASYHFLLGKLYWEMNGNLRADKKKCLAQFLKVTAACCPFFSLFVIAYLSVLSKTSTPVILSVKLSSIPFYASHLVFPFSQIFPAGRSNSTDPIVQQTAVIQKLYLWRYHRINHYSADKCCVIQWI